VGLSTELFYATYAYLLSLHLITFLMFFILVHVTFWQQMHARAEVFHLSQSSKSVLTDFFSRYMQYWLKNHDQTRLSSNTPCTPTEFLIQQSCAIITFQC